MEIQIAGQLFWRDDTYLLVDPDPVLEKRSWLGDNMREFVVCSEDGHVFNLVVTPPFAVSYRRMGEKIQVKEQEQKELLVYPWMEQLLKEEPASFAE